MAIHISNNYIPLLQMMLRKCIWPFRGGGAVSRDYLQPLDQHPILYVRLIVCCHGNGEKMKGLNCDIYCI